MIREKPVKKRSTKKRKSVRKVKFGMVNRVDPLTRILQLIYNEQPSERRNIQIINQVRLLSEPDFNDLIATMVNNYNVSLYAMDKLRTRKEFELLLRAGRRLPAINYGELGMSIASMFHSNPNRYSLRSKL